ncbi:MAG: glycoside hydrolase family 3 protein [Chthonomonadales bacterium]|nr:glycoside hydrolase family 3 protein [Chthonomonadales bacterium]
MPTPKYLSPRWQPATRAADLTRRMTLEEKVSQLVHDAAAIPRLAVPAYNWWNECLHGVGRAGVATVFPQAIGLAATWNSDLMHRVAVAISDEARAKHHEEVRQRGHSGWYTGLTFWSPNINIFRDPRWGRGQETHGEDPYLTSRMGVAFVRGLQGEHPRYLKLVATPKHFAVHSGPEALRHGFDARVSLRDLHETYLPAFRACIKEAKAASIMPAYNRTNGEACAASPTLLGEILRGAWGFKGYVVSDCGAIDDIYRHHGLASSREEAAALSVRAGCDLNCGDTYCGLSGAVMMGLLSEDELDRAVERLFEARFRLGMFDPPEMVPFAQIPYSVNDCDEHRKLARQAARESIVLLENRGILPFDGGIRRIAVIGPNADDVETLLGNYNGEPSRAVTHLAGIRERAGRQSEVRYVPGCELTGPKASNYAEAESVARWADVAVLVLGLSPRLEGEEGEANLIDKGGDRKDIGLPDSQEGLLEAVLNTGTPTVVALLGGSALAACTAAERADALLVAWYGGEEAGSAMADILFGDVSPAGRLPVTFYRSLDQLPPFEDYAMAGRTYRFFEGEPLYRFGHGLSYSTFAYSNLSTSRRTLRTGERLTVEALVTNTGSRAADEVVQLYVCRYGALVPVLLRQLAGFQRIHLGPGESVPIRFTLTPRQMAWYDDDGYPVVGAGPMGIAVGGAQPGGSWGSHGPIGASGGEAVLTTTVTVSGGPRRLPI